MDIKTYTERATVIFASDGSVKGSEAHVLTGYEETRNVPDAPGGQQIVFVVVSQEVRPVEAADFEAVMNSGADLATDNAAKAAAIQGMAEKCSIHQAIISGLINAAVESLGTEAVTQIVTAAGGAMPDGVATVAGTIADQAATIEAGRTGLADLRSVYNETNALARREGQRADEAEAERDRLAAEISALAPAQ